MPQITRLSARPWGIELNEPFGIATGAQQVAANVLVEVELSDGTVGLGEAAPFPAVNGETQASALAALRAAEEWTLGREANDWQNFAGEACFATDKSALCALETAVLDALCRQQGVSLWAWAGGRQGELVSDITIPTGSVAQAHAAAEAAAERGFEVLKIKVGGVNLDLDVQRIAAALAVRDAIRVIIDGNAALTTQDALELIECLGAASPRIAVFEQPTAKDDLDALRELRAKTGIKIAADESASSARDVERLAQSKAVDIVNIKIMKSGVSEALRMIDAAKRHGLGLMIGGMVESELAMTVSASIAAGIGGFEWVDLDTPLFMKGAPTRGGVQRSGAKIRLDSNSFGHGVEPNP